MKGQGDGPEGPYMVPAKDDIESDTSDLEEDPFLVEEERTVVKNRSFPWLIMTALLCLVAMKSFLYFLPVTFPDKTTADLESELEVGHDLTGPVGLEDFLSVTLASSTALVLSEQKTVGTSWTTSTSLAVASSTDVLPSPSEAPVWPLQSYKTEEFTAPQLIISKTGETAPGLLFFGPRGNGTHSQAPMIMAEDGELVWHGPSGTSTNLMLQDVNGSSHITFWHGASAFTFGHGYGAVHVLDDSYEEVAVACPKGLDIVTEAPDAGLDCLLDMHESFITSTGALVVTAYNITAIDLSDIGGPKDGWISNSMFYEIDITTQETLFSWRSLDHLDQIPLNQTKYPMFVRNKTFGATSETPFDYFHINSVQPLEDGYLVNSRHMWSVFKIRLDGSIEWQLQGDTGGDFATNHDFQFSWQHDARAVNITQSSLHLNMFSNSNSEAQDGLKDSKGLELFLDLETRQATVLRTLVDLNDPRHSTAMGSWQSLPDGHVLIGYGKDATIKEFDHADQVVWSAKFGNTTEGNGGIGVVASYRAYKFPWTTMPAATPKLAVEYSEAENVTWVFASWNGATPDVFDNWIVGTRDADYEDMNFDAGHDRLGFETGMRVEGMHRYWQVTARRGEEELRSSGIVKLT